MGQVSPGWGNISQFCINHFTTSRWIEQEALNTWRERLQHFLQLLYNQKIQKVILIRFVHLLKSNKFSEFHRCGSKNVPATPIFILNFPRAWQSFKVSYALQIWWKVKNS